MRLLLLLLLLLLFSMRWISDTKHIKSGQFQGFNCFVWMFTGLLVFWQDVLCLIFLPVKSHLYCICEVYSGFCLANKEINNNNRIQRRHSRFSTISSLRREPSPTRTLFWPGHNRVQIMCNTSSTYYVRHVMLHATWYEGTA